MLRAVYGILLICLLLHGACAAQVGSSFSPDSPPAQQPDEHLPEEPDAGSAGISSTLGPFPAEALVGWLKAEPLPDTPIRLRLRDAALFAVLNPELRWELVVLAPGEPARQVLAVLELPDGSPGWPLYSVDAAYGPARSDAESGDSHWPLILANGRLPLAKLKLVASRPASGTPFPKAIDVVRVADDGSVLRSLASGVVNPDGVAGAGPNWFELRPEISPDKWVVQVHELLGSASTASPPPMLQLSKIDAYAAEAFIRTTAPSNAELRLRIYTAEHPDAPESAPQPNEVEASLSDQPAPDLYGELRSLSPFTPTPTTTVQDRSKRPHQPNLPGIPSLPPLPGWAPSLVLGLAGFFLLWIGIRLMQPPRTRL
jgi:hypothetical protein